MAIVIILLRALHILGGIFWAGATVVVYGFVVPSARAVQPDGARFMRQLTARSGLASWMTVANAACLVGGLVLFSPVSGHFDRDWMGSTRGIVLSVGALIGLLASLEGLAFLGPTSRKLGALAIAAGDSPSPEQAKRLAELQGKLARSGMRGAWMVMFAAALMAVARYV